MYYAQLQIVPCVSDIRPIVVCLCLPLKYAVYYTLSD